MIEIDASEVAAFAGKMANASNVVETELAAGLRGIAEEGVSIASSLAPRATGALAASIVITKSSPLMAEFGPTATRNGFPYPIAVERGRKGFSARSGGVLAFTVGGKAVFVKRVGPAAARPFMKPTVARLKPIVTARGHRINARIIASLS